MQQDVQKSVVWLRTNVGTDFWDKVHRQYYIDPKISAHAPYGACLIPNGIEYGHVIVDLDQGGVNIWNKWIEPEKCRNEYFPSDQWVLVDATNHVYKRFLCALWPMATLLKDVYDEEKIGDRVEAVLGGCIVHKLGLLCSKRTDPVHPGALAIFEHMSKVLVAAKVDWKRLGEMRFIL